MTSSQLLRDNNRQILRKLREENRTVLAKSSSELVFNIPSSEMRIEKIFDSNDDSKNAGQEESMTENQTNEIKTEGNENHSTQQSETSMTVKNNKQQSSNASALSALLHKPISSAGMTSVNPWLPGDTGFLPLNNTPTAIQKNHSPRKTKPRKRKNVVTSVNIPQSDDKKDRDDSWLDTYKVNLDRQPTFTGGLDSVKLNNEPNPVVEFKEFNKVLTSLDQRFIQESNKHQHEKPNNNGCDTPTSDQQMSSGENFRASQKSRNPNIQESHHILHQHPNVTHLHKWFVAFQRMLSAASDPTNPLWQPMIDNCVNTNGGQQAVPQANGSSAMSPIMLAAITAATFQLMSNAHSGSTCNPCMSLHSKIATNLTQNITASHLQCNVKMENLLSSSNRIDVPSSSQSPIPLPAVYQMLNALALQETHSLNAFEIRHENTHTQLDNSREMGYPSCSEPVGTHAPVTTTPLSQGYDFQRNISPGTNSTKESDVENINANGFSTSARCTPNHHHQCSMTNNSSASTISYITEHLRQKKQQRLQRDVKCRNYVKTTGDKSADVSMTGTQTRRFMDESIKALEEKRPYPLVDRDFDDDQEMGEAVDLSVRQNNNNACLERHNFTSSRKRSKNYDKESAQCYSAPSTNKSIISLILKQNSDGIMERLDKQKEVKGESDCTDKKCTSLNWQMSNTQLERFLETTISSSVKYLGTLELDNEQKMKILEACWYRLFVIHVVGEESEGFTTNVEELLSYIYEYEGNVISNNANIKRTHDSNKNGKSINTFQSSLNRLINKGCKLNLDYQFRRLACQIFLINEAKRTNLHSEQIAKSESDLNTALGTICNEVGEGNGQKSETSCMRHAQFILFMNRVCSMPSFDKISEHDGVLPDRCVTFRLLTSFRDKLQNQINMTTRGQESHE